MKAILTSLFTLSAIITASAQTTAPTVDEIVAKANQASYYQGKNGRAKVSMSIVGTPPVKVRPPRLRSVPESHHCAPHNKRQQECAHILADSL